MVKKLKFWLYFTLHYLGLVLLLPIRVLVNFIARLIGYRDLPIIMRQHFNTKYLSKPKLTNAKVVIEHRIKFTLNDIVNHGDGCKFFGLLIASDPKKEYIDYFVNYVNDDGLFIRRQKYKDVIINKKGNFSGDMWAGFYPAIFEILRNLNKYDGNTSEKIVCFVDRLIKAIDKALFEVPYLQFKSNYKYLDRGYLFRYFFSNAGHYLPILSMLLLQHELTGKFIYKFLYYLIYPLFYIDSLVNPTFYISYKDYRYTDDYYVHSNFIFYYYLYKQTGNKHYKKCYMFIKERFSYNPEFLALSLEDNLISNSDDIRDILLYLSDYVTKLYEEVDRNQMYELLEFIEVKDIKCLVKNKLIKRRKDRTCTFKESKYVIPPRFISNDYLWEKSLRKYQYYISSTTGIDYVRLVNILQSKNILTKEK